MKQGKRDPLHSKADAGRFGTITGFIVYAEDVAEVLLMVVT